MVPKELGQRGLCQKNLELDLGPVPAGLKASDGRRQAWVSIQAHNHCVTGIANGRRVSTAKQPENDPLAQTTRPLPR